MVMQILKVSLASQKLVNKEAEDSQAPFFIITKTKTEETYFDIRTKSFIPHYKLDIF